MNTINKNGKIFSEDGEHELTIEQCDFNAGYLQECEEIIKHGAIEPREEKGHFIVLATYENGGKDVEWIVDEEAQEGRPAWDEVVVYSKYVSFTEAEIQKKHNLAQIAESKQKLQDSDFKLLKYLEGHYTEEEYKPIKEKREEYRKFIRDLEKHNEELDKITEQERNK